MVENRMKKGARCRYRSLCFVPHSYPDKIIVYKARISDHNCDKLCQAKYQYPGFYGTT